MSTAHPDQPPTAMSLTAQALRMFQNDERARRNGIGWVRTLAPADRLPLVARVERMLELAQQDPEWRTADPDALAFRAAVQHALDQRMLSWLPALRPTAEQHWRPAALRGDWMHSDTPSYLGWIMDGYRWNGWVVPRLPAAEARRLVADNIHERQAEPHGDPSDELWIVSDTPQLVVELHRSVYVDTPDYEPEQYVEDFEGTLGVGAMMWTWQEDIESGIAAQLRLRDTDPINDRRGAARFLRRCAQLPESQLDVTAPAVSHVDDQGVALFGAYDAELYDARRGEALSVFAAAGDDDALAYVAAVTPVQTDDAVFVPSATKQRVESVLLHLHAAGWPAAPGHEPADVDVTLPSGHTVGFALGDPGTRYLAGLFAPDGTPIETPEVADILDAYHPAPHTSRAFAQESTRRIVRALVDLRALLGNPS